MDALGRNVPARCRWPFRDTQTSNSRQGGEIVVLHPAPASAPQPGDHVVVAVCAAGGALLFVGQGYPLVAVFALSLGLLNVAHAVAEYRRPDYRQQWPRSMLRCCASLSVSFTPRTTARIPDS